MSDDEALLSVKQVAARLGCSTDTVRRRVLERELPSLKLGGLRRIAASDLDAYIARQRADEADLTQFQTKRKTA